MSDGKPTPPRRRRRRRRRRTGIRAGDCIESMKTLEDNSVHSIVTDPPYGLKFLGKDWDNLGHGNAQTAWHRRWTDEAFRVLKPGGFIAAFGGSKTSHRLACALEDSGFEIWDSITWLCGDRMPKGGRLRPLGEPIVLARKPFKGSLRAHLETTGLGALNTQHTPPRRHPANVALTHSDACEDQCTENCPVRILDAQSGKLRARGNVTPTKSGTSGMFFGDRGGSTTRVDSGDSGGASRFYYVAKAPNSERWGYCHTCNEVVNRKLDAGVHPKADHKLEWHPTVKPIKLMEWLVNLTRGQSEERPIILDPFSGTGTTGEVVLRLGGQFIGMEKNPIYYKIAAHRLRLVSTR